MPFTMKDITSGVYILYIDNSGRVGLMGSANADQALSFAGAGVITSGAYMANGIAPVGSPSPLTGTIVIPVGSSSTISYSVPQAPTVMANVYPDSVSNTATVLRNATGADVTYSYKLW